MAQLWLPGAERRPQSGGSSMVGGPPRSIWHITWDKLGPGGRMPSFDAIAGYLEQVEYCPHLMWDPWTGRIVQFYPADVSARAVRNLAGGVETNRMGSACLQVEAWFSPGAVVGGRKYMTLADTPAVGIDRIVAWMRANGIPDRWPCGWPTWDGNRNSVTWQRQAGHYGHSQVPENDHTDPGPMPTHMFNDPAPHPPAPQEDDMPYGQLSDGPQAITPISLPKGKYKAIGFLGDNGLQHLPPAAIRVAMHSAAHGWDVKHLVVDSTKDKTWINFTHPEDTDGVSVQREDNGAVHLAWDAS